MTSEILRIDANNKVVAGFVTDDASQEIRNARIDDTTKGLKVMIVGGAGSGTVTSVGTGTGLTGGPITTTGTISLDSKLSPLDSLTGNALKFLRVNAGETAVEYASPSGAGTVTSVSVTSANGFAGSISNPTTTPAITLTTTNTTGSVLFADSNALGQDNTNFLWDNTNKRLAIGGTTGTGANSGLANQIPLTLEGNLNQFIDLEIQNVNNGDSASTDISISADNDSTTLIGHYSDIGIWGSGFSAAAVGNVRLVSVNAGGSSYAPGDVATISGGGDGNATVTVATVGGGGAVTSVTLTENGTGYSVASGLTTTSSPGSGLTINVLSLIDNSIFVANDGYMYTSGGNLVISTDDSVANKIIKFSIGGFATASEVARFSATKGTMTLGLAGTNQGILQFSGSTSGTTNLQPAVAASGTLTLPSATDTLTGKATTDIFTNKTYDTAGTGNVFKINGTQISAVTGTGSAVLATSPTLVTPVLGVATATSINKVAITAPATSATLTIADGKTTTHNATTTFAGTDGKTLTISNSLTLAGTDGKTLTVSNSLTLAGTDSTTMTFPSTSASIARTDAAQTFTGTQTFSQVITTNNAITASGNAATVPITSKTNTVTNNSAATLTITMTTTSAVDGQVSIVRVLDATNVAQTITWVNTENSTVAAPTTSNGSTTLPLTVGFQYNTNTSKWRCIASA